MVLMAVLVLIKSFTVTETVGNVRVRQTSLSICLSVHCCVDVY